MVVTSLACILLSFFEILYLLGKRCCEFFTSVHHSRNVNTHAMSSGNKLMEMNALKSADKRSPDTPAPSYSVAVSWDTENIRKTLWKRHGKGKPSLLILHETSLKDDFLFFSLRLNYSVVYSMCFDNVKFCTARSVIDVGPVETSLTVYISIGLAGNKSQCVWCSVPSSLQIKYMSHSLVWRVWFYTHVWFSV